MNKQMMVVSVVCLAAGLGGGGAATYMWLRASSGANAETRQSDHDDHDSADEEHDGHDENDDHGEEDDHGLIRLSSAELDEFGIEVQTAIGGQIVGTLTLPGEIVLNADQVAHIVPRVPGIVKRVDKRLGDDVKPTEVMAVLESRELAEAKAEYLAAGQRLALAQATFASSETLKGKGIMPELDFLAIRRERDEARIEVRAAEYKLHALGLTDEEIKLATRCFSQNEMTDKAMQKLKQRLDIAPTYGIMLRASIPQRQIPLVLLMEEAKILILFLVYQLGLTKLISE